MALPKVVNPIKDKKDIKPPRGQQEVDALLLSLGEGVIATDAEGHINRVNSVALEILGFKQKDLMGKWYPGAVIAEDMDGVQLSNLNRPITQAFLSAKPISARIRLKRKDGSRVPVSLNVSPILVGKKPIGAVEVFRDITEELSLEQAKDDFISIASHQLRTPATGVKQYLGMVLEGYAEKLKPNQKALLERAYESNERQLTIIDDLLKVARIDAGNIALDIDKTDLITLINDIVFEQAIKIKQHQHKVSFSHPGRVIKIEADIRRLRMVLENLLDNAIKYSPDGSRIEIKAYKINDQAIVQLIDQGVGIAKEDVAKVFQKFQRIPNPLSIEAGGTGLGLYWSERIIKLHGGHISLSSRLNRGSCFSVYLPLKVPKSLQPSKS